MSFSLGVSEYEAIAQFTAFIEANVKPRNTLTIKSDGNTHRFTIEGDKAGSKNGAYAFSPHGRDGNSLPNGYVKNWKTGNVVTWHYEPSYEERKAYGLEQHNPEAQAKHEQQRKEREKKLAEEKKLQEEKQAKAQAMALAEYNAASHYSWIYDRNRAVPYDDILSVPYLQSKFAGTGIRYIDDGQFDYVAGSKNLTPRVCVKSIEGGICKPYELLVPMRDVATGNFKTLIRISDKPNNEGRWTKNNYTGISPTGSAYIIQPQHAKEEAIYITEGFATAIAAMISLESRYTVFAVGSCNNLLPVCQALRKRYSKGKIIIIADNDTAGIKHAQECVKAQVANAFITPEGAGVNDWCDWLIATTMEGAKK